MGKTIKLEIKKILKHGYIKHFLVTLAFIILSGLVILPIGSEQISTAAFVENAAFLRQACTGIFIVFNATLVSTFLIREFRDQTITVLFSYPVGKKGIIISKFLSVLLFSFIGIFFSIIITTFSIYFIASISSKIVGTITIKHISHIIGTALLYSIIFSFISFSGLLISFTRRSVMTNIITALIIMFALNSEIYNFTLSKSLLAPIICSAIGLITCITFILLSEKINVYKIIN